MPLRKRVALIATVVYNIFIACNRSTADFLLSSPLMNGEHQPAAAEA